MAFQSLQGITITPKGSYNLSRFGQDFNGTSWPTSYAFGGWIYNTSCEIGYSNQPTEIKVNIVLETVDKSQISNVFDIKKSDIKIDAGEGADENTFDINLNGINFSDFVLFSYEISIEAGSKILNVTFRDYSIILDKIYVGLLKRQGNRFVKTANSTIEFPVNCADCSLNGDSFNQIGAALRDVNFGSYVGINAEVYDNFESLDPTGNIYRRWEKLFSAAASNVKFDLNGGFLILGTEEVTEERCGDLGSISYNFNQLLASLRFRGINFTGAFPVAISDSDFIYKQNYIGTLREVLQQWCSDLGYDFYCEGKSFIGININQALDISKIIDVADPTTELGSQFSLNKNAAVISYKENNTIANSYRQSVITANANARQSKKHSKSPKRYIGFLPLHPIDFNIPSRKDILRYDLFGNTYPDRAWVNSFEPNSADLDKTLYQLDNRTFRDVDTAIALSHYDLDLRDIYCQDRAIYGETAEIRAANFKALGLIPLIEIDGSDKSTAIEAVFSSEAGDEATSVCLDKRFYRVYVGYFYSKFKEDITNWEQAAAESMYKYGAVTKGLLHGLPYMPNNIIQDVSPHAGLYGTYGVSTTRIQHNYEPDAKQYFDLYKAPFKDIILYSGLRNRGDYFPEDFYIGEISNDWGTTQEQFKRELSLKLDDACVEEFAQNQSYTNFSHSIEKKYQDWKLNQFKPQVISDLGQFFHIFQSALTKINDSATIDRTVQQYYDLNYRVDNTCAKLHIIILTDTRTHPNIYIDFTRVGRNFVNPVVLQKYRENHFEALKRKSMTKTNSDCDKSLLQEMCENLLYTNSLADFSDPKFACALQDEHNAFEEGFDTSYLSSPNSRGLDIRIIKNPIRNNDTDTLQNLFRNSDVNGSFYYIDTVSQANSFQQRQANLTIIYPISSDAEDNIYYKGILTSDVEIENRSPEINEIFGEPPNRKNNPCAGVKVINNTIDPILQPQLDPYSSRFLSYITVVTGDNQIITTVSGYHEFINKLNNYEATGVTKSIELSLAGTPDFFGSFSGYLSPLYGLNKMSISVNDNGVVTSLSYSDRPPQLPKQESILNRIGPRIK